MPRNLFSLVLITVVSLTTSSGFASSGLAPADVGDPSIPDLIYDWGTGEVTLDVDGSGIIGYVLKNGAGTFVSANHAQILAGVKTSTAGELSEAAFSSSVGANSIGNVFPLGMDLATLASYLTVNDLSRFLGAPVVPFDLEVINQIVGDSSGNASFDSVLDQNSLSIDFGTVPMGSSELPIDFQLSNLFAAVGNTAKVELVDIVGSGDTGTLSTDLALFDNLLAGLTFDFSATIDTSVAGSFAASYELDFTSPFSVYVETLTLDISGVVEAVGSTVPEPSTYFLAAIGLLG